MYLFILLIPDTGISLQPLEDKILELTSGFSILPNKIPGKYITKNKQVLQDSSFQYLIAGHVFEIQEIAKFAKHYLRQEQVIFWKESEYVELI